MDESNGLYQDLNNPTEWEDGNSDEQYAIQTSHFED